MPTFIKDLPIYSIAVYKFYIYMSGGGGGSTGIPNQIIIFKRKITPQPLKRFQTGTKIVENMNVNEVKNMMICTKNQNIVLYGIREEGVSLQMLMEFQGDFSLRNPITNAIFFHPHGTIFCSGGDDKYVRFFSIQKQTQKPQLIWEHDENSGPIRNIDYNGGELYVSCDKLSAVVSNLKSKEVVRKVYNDQVIPQESFFQAVYFHSRNKTEKLVFCHYVHAKNAYITKQKQNGKFFTLKVHNDQSCLTAKEANYVGIACGKGLTFIVDIQSMQIVGKEHRHKDVITGAIMTRGKRFITGTSSCSYFIQEANPPFPTILWALGLCLLLILFVGIDFFKKGVDVDQQL